MRFLVTGATGFIGAHLVSKLARDGHDVVILTRAPDLARNRFAKIQFVSTRPLVVYGWDSLKHPPSAKAFEGVDVVVNLAGTPINERWTEKKKREIRDSRMLGTRYLVQAVTEMNPKPKVLISMSAVGFYGDRGNEILDESSFAGEGFLSEVCRDWEREALAATHVEGLRFIRLRMGLVLGRDGGALPTLRKLYLMGIGGKIGTGDHWVSWIHIEDAIAMLEWAWANSEIDGVLNAVSPQPIPQAAFAQALASALGRPCLVRTPRFALRLALGEMADLAIQSQRVFPSRAVEKGFVFRYPEIDEALKALL